MKNRKSKSSPSFRKSLELCPHGGKHKFSEIFGGFMCLTVLYKKCSKCGMRILFSLWYRCGVLFLKSDAERGSHTSP